MKIPNYDPGFFKSNYKQGHPCMPADVFRMLICGPSNSGKTNILLHMLYELLEFDKITSSQKTCIRTNTRLFCSTLLNKSTPRLVMRSSRLMVMKSFHSKNFRWTTKKLLFLMILFVKATKTASLNIFTTGGTETAALFTSLKTSTRRRKTPVITAAIFVFSDVFQEISNGLQTR